MEVYELVIRKRTEENYRDVLFMVHSSNSLDIYQRSSFGELLHVPGFQRSLWDLYQGGNVSLRLLTEPETKGLLEIIGIQQPITPTLNPDLSRFSEDEIGQEI